MSLHQIANHVQSAGRGEDKVLVHMTPGEVKGLQSIAMAHGGSLTINPQTGLPEAGFLSSLLPTILGAGLSLIPGVGPLMAAGIVGGGTALSTGSLQKGLMAGLGAYGGAGLTGGLMAAGTSALPGAAAPTSTLSGTSQLAKVGAENFAAPTMFQNAATANPAMSTAAQQAGGFRPFVNADIMAANPYGLPAVTASPTSINFSPPPVTPAPPGEIVGMPDVPVNPPPTASMDAGFRGPVKPLAYGEGVTSPTYSNFDKLKAGFSDVTSSGDKALGFMKENPGTFMNLGLSALQAMTPKSKSSEQNKGMIRPYTFDYNPTNVAAQPYSGSAERLHFNPVYTAGTPYAAPGPEYKATGGLTGLYAQGGTTPMTARNPVEQMSNQNAIGNSTGYPMANVRSATYALPTERPMSQNVISSSGDVSVDPYTGEERFAGGGGVSGGYNLGDYSDGGRLLRGPGDGVSDDIPAQIGDRQPARLADGEFVVPARIVSELGNGSTEAGARQLYAMMDRVQKARGKTVGKGKVAVNSKAGKLLPA